MNKKTIAIIAEKNRKSKYFEDTISVFCFFSLVKDEEKIFVFFAKSS